MDAKVITLLETSTAVVDCWRNGEILNADDFVSEEAYDLFEALEDAVNDMEVDDEPVVEEEA